MNKYIVYYTEMSCGSAMIIHPKCTEIINIRKKHFDDIY